MDALNQQHVVDYAAVKADRLWHEVSLLDILLDELPRHGQKAPPSVESPEVTGELRPRGDHELAMKFWDSKMPATRIAEVFGVRPCTIYSWKRKHGWKERVGPMAVASTTAKTENISHTSPHGRPETRGIKCS